MLVETPNSGPAYRFPRRSASYYDQHRDEYRVPEQVNVSHILIKTPLPGTDGKVDDKGVDAAQQSADDVLKQLKAGAKFEDLAKKYSEDPGSAKDGGSLGWIGEGLTVPEFEKAAFSLPKGRSAIVVKSGYGFHIIRVDDKQDAHAKSAGRGEGRDRAHPEAAESAAGRAEPGRSLLKQAREQGLGRGRCGEEDSRDQLGLLRPQRHAARPWAASQFTDAVFGRNEKAPPDVAPASQGIVVFQLLAVKPAATPTFEEIRSRVEEEFKNERSSHVADAENSGTVGPRQGRARSEARREGTGRDDEDQRLCSAGRAGARRRFDVGTGLGSLQHEAGRDQRSDQQRHDRRGAGGNSKTSSLPTRTMPPSAIRFVITAAAEAAGALWPFRFESDRRDDAKSGKIKSNEDEIKLLTRNGSEPGECSGGDMPFPARRRHSVASHVVCLRAAGSVILGLPPINL